MAKKGQKGRPFQAKLQTAGPSIDRLDRELAKPSLDLEDCLELMRQAMAKGDMAALRALAEKPTTAPDEEEGWDRPMGASGRKAPRSRAQLMRDQEHPIAQAAKLGNVAALEAMLPSACSEGKVLALEAAAQWIQDEAFDAVLAGIEVPPMPEGGWLYRMEADESGSRAIALDESGAPMGAPGAPIRRMSPFGLAYEEAARSGNLRAMRALAGRLPGEGAQSEAGVVPEQSSEPASWEQRIVVDRLREWRCFEIAFRDLQKCERVLIFLAGRLPLDVLREHMRLAAKEAEHVERSGNVFHAQSMRSALASVAALAEARELREHVGEAPALAAPAARL